MAWWVLALALGALVLLPASAPASKFPRARFKLSVSGSQTTTFSENDLNCVGSGQEEITFATPNPLPVTVIPAKANGTGTPLLDFGKAPKSGYGGDSSFNVSATVHRAQTWTDTGLCTEGTHNCDATAQTGWRLLVFMLATKRNTVSIEDDPFLDNAQPDPLAAGCFVPSVVGSYFPTLFCYVPNGNVEQVTAPLSAAGLFNKNKQKLASHGQGSDHHDIFGDTSDTTTDWTVHLNRIK